MYCHPMHSVIKMSALLVSTISLSNYKCGLVAEWLVCWTQAQKGPGSNRSHDAVG